MVSSAKGVKARPESPFFWNGTNDHEKYRSFSVRSYLSNKAKTRPERFPCVKELVRWATGKRLTDRLPELSPITLSPPSEQRGLRSSYRAVRPYSEFLLQSLGTKGE